MTSAYDLLLKYVINLLKEKRPQVWRSIKTNNTAFKARVACMKGAEEILRNAGYTEARENSMCFPDSVEEPDKERLSVIAAELLMAKLEVEQLNSASPQQQRMASMQVDPSHRQHTEPFHAGTKQFGQQGSFQPGQQQYPPHSVHSQTQSNSAFPPPSLSQSQQQPTGYHSTQHGRYPPTSDYGSDSSAGRNDTSGSSSNTSSLGTHSDYHASLSDNQPIHHGQQNTMTSYSHLNNGSAYSGQNAGGHYERPGSHEMRPSSHEMRPGSHEMRLGSHEMRPGSHEMRPGSHEIRPEKDFQSGLFSSRQGLGDQGGAVETSSQSTG